MLMNTINKINRIAKNIIFYFCILLRILFPHKKSKKSNNVLLVSDGHIGDAVINASVWETLIEYYSVQNKNIYLLARREAWNYLNLVLDIKKIKHIEYDAEKYFNKLPRLINLLSFEIIIARVHGNLQLFTELTTINSNRRIAVVEQEMYSGIKGMITKISSYRYSDIIVETFNMNERMSIEKLVQTVGIDDYIMRIIPIPTQFKNQEKKDNYITIAVDSQNSSRRWPSRKFISLIHHLIKRYTEDIYLTGSYLSENEIAKYKEEFGDNKRVKIAIGKLSFVDWVELLRGANYHIGVDSGSIHVAVSVGTQTFCLVGVWHGHRFFPYDLQTTIETPKPICVYAEDCDAWSCFGCAIKKKYGWGNNECSTHCKNKKSCMCLEQITVDDVLSTISNAKLIGVID